MPTRNNPPPPPLLLQIGLCLPDKDSCRTRKDNWMLKQMNGPLNQKGFLGRLLFNKKGNRDELINLLRVTNYAPFTDHAAALKAGSDLLMKRNESQSLQMGGEA